VTTKALFHLTLSMIQEFASDKIIKFFIVFIPLGANIRIVVFNATFNNISVKIVAVSCTGGGNRSAR
jgi:hypothetical protein